MEAWPEKALKSESGGFAWCWWGVEGEEVEGGSETVGCQLQEGSAVGFSVLVEEVGVVEHCSASTGAVASLHVTGLGRTWGEEGEAVEGEEQRSLDSAHCGAEAATTTVTQRGKGMQLWT